MPVVVNGSGTVTGISTGGISDTKAVADAAMPAGAILQVQSTTKTDTFSTASTSQVDITGFSVNITPISSSNKILVSGTMAVGLSTNVTYSIRFYLMRGSTGICIHDTAGNRSRCTFGTQGVLHTDNTVYFPFEFLDDAQDTNAHTYKVQVQAERPHTVYINRCASEGDGDVAITPRFTSTITAKEVAA